MKKSNHAFIDGANLHSGVKSLGWELDYKRFRVWLYEKYSVSVAYIFLGFIPKYKPIYDRLHQAGFSLVFKKVAYGGDGKIKGNCDADLVLKITQEMYANSFEKAVLVSSDGDFAGLVSLLLSINKVQTVLSPYGSEKCSILLKKTGVNIVYISDQKSLLGIQNEKAPDGDKTP